MLIYMFSNTQWMHLIRLYIMWKFWKLQNWFQKVIRKMTIFYANWVGFFIFIAFIIYNPRSKFHVHDFIMQKINP
jgi:hypothetical protein